MKTYKLKSVEVEHPKLGKLTKQNIVYYENKDDKGTPEYYKEGETDIRFGYTEKP